MYILLQVYPLFTQQSADINGKEPRSQSNAVSLAFF